MRCLIRSHRQDYKLPLPNEEAEQVGGLEPDPRYIRCCSTVCRPGYALRDALLGLLVLLGLSVVVTVIFVVCFYVIPDEKQLIDEGILPGTAKGVIGGPEHLNEVTLREGDKYTLPPHNFDDGGKGGDFGDIHGDLSQDFTTFSPPSGGVQDTTDPALHLQDENAEVESAQDLPIVHHEDRVPEETLQPRENFDLHLPEESNDTQPEPNVGPQDGPEGVIEQGHFQRDGDGELKGSRVHPEESADSVALQDEEQEGCSPVQLPMCISSVPWTLAGSPNWLNHTSEGEMFAALPYIRSSLLDSGCSSLAPLYACSVLEPPCRNSRVLPPCRTFCEEVAQSCQPFVQGASLPGLFHCSRYPDSADPSICISAQQDVEALSDSEGPSSHSNLSEPSNDAANLHTGATRQQANRISPYDYNEYTDNISTEDRRAVVFGDVIRPEDEKVEAKQQPLNISENQPNERDQQNVQNEPARHQSVERRDPSIVEQLIPELPVNHQFGEAKKENPAHSNQSGQQILPIQTEAANNPSPEGLFDISDLLGVQGNASYYKEVLGAPEEETALAICTLDMFMCNDGSDCINDTFVCDQVQNCVDNSDETNCSAVLKDDNRDAANREQPSQQPISEPDESSNVNEQNNFATVKTPSSSNVAIASSKLSEIVSTSHTTFAPAPPINDLTTTHALADAEDSTVEVASPTTMSLADRLKLAMSKSTSKPSNPKAPTERIQRHSVSPSVQTFSPINTEDDINSDGMSLADRLSTVTTERIRRFRTSLEPTDAAVTPPKIRPVNDDPTVESASEETTIAGASGVMSLAELLALSNKAKPSPKPSNRATPQRRIATSGGNRLSDQLAEASVTTTERFDSTSTRFRFRGNDRPSSQTPPRFEEEDEEGEERRIPVRTVDEVPKIKFSFPMRNPSGKPIPFRTTAEPPTREELLAAVTARTVSRVPFSSRFVPSTTTEETAVTENETTKMTSTTDQPTTTTVAITTNLPTTTKQNIDPVSSIESCPELQCLDGKCIAIIQLNDGVIDCSDGSDEQDFGGLVT